MQLYQGISLVQPYCHKVGDKSGSINMNFATGLGTTYLYRYFRLDVYEIQGTDSSILQFSQLKFIDKNGNRFKYPVGMTGQEYSFERCQDPSESPIRGTSDTQNSKCCMKDTYSSGGYIIYDLGSECLDVKTYNRWIWWSSNDSYSLGRFMKKFKMSVYNSVDNIVIFDNKYEENGYEITDSMKPTSYRPYKLMYTSDFFDYKKKGN